LDATRPGPPVALSRGGLLALPGAGQAQRGSVGVEVWHLRAPPYRAEEKRTRDRQRGSCIRFKQLPSALLERLRQLIQSTLSRTS